VPDDIDPLDAASKALAHEQFVQDKLAKGRVMYFRRPDGSFEEQSPDGSDDSLDPANDPYDPEPKGPKIMSAARALEPEDPWPDGDLRSAVE